MSTAHSGVDHPQHYTSHPSGVECIEITRHMTFNAGNAVKYLWRAGLKEPDGVSGVERHGELSSARLKHIEDLRKARWYITDEIKRLGGEEP